MAEKDSDTAVIFTAFNSTDGVDLPASLTIRSWPKLAVLNERPISFVFTDVGAYADPRSPARVVWVAGCHSDSAWILSFSLQSVSPDSMRLVPRDSFFIGTGDDHTGNGRWESVTQCVGQSDYDSDGHTELFLYLTSMRDKTPRSLTCIDLVNSQIEWQTPIASQLEPGDILDCRDSQVPSILVAASGPGQGVADSLFADSYSYLARIGSHGQVLDKWILSRYPTGIAITEVPDDTIAFVSHTLPFLSSSTTADSLPLSFMISRISRTGVCLKTVAVSDAVTYLWTADYDSDGRQDLYALTSARRILVFDQSLNLIARTNPIANGYVGKMAGWGEEHLVLFLSAESDMTQVLSPRLERLAILPSYCEYSEPVKVDPVGRVVVTLGGHSRKGIYATMERRGPMEMLSIFYVNNQKYVLAVLSSLLVALVATQLYRRRVSIQKLALEQAHQELVKAHEDLRIAQATIVEQEKYRQAKDIAGGFAHEIKNALFPADGALIKQERLLQDPTPDFDRLQATHQTIRGALARAVRLTRLITAYTGLESELVREPVNLSCVLDDILRANRGPIEAQKLNLVRSGSADVMASVSAEHLCSVFTNLLVNSLDALAGRPDPTVRVEWAIAGDQVVIDWSDNGSGIAEADLARIFDAFFSTKPTTGTGLGLSMTKKIVELYGGSIAVASRPGEGTTFHLKLPIIEG